MYIGVKHIGKKMHARLYFKVMIVASSAEKNGVGKIVWKEWLTLYTSVFWIVTENVHSRITMYIFLKRELGFKPWSPAVQQDSQLDKHVVIETDLREHHILVVHPRSLKSMYWVCEIVDRISSIIFCVCLYLVFGFLCLIQIIN